MLEDGSRARLQVTTVETCFQARGLALFGDRQAEARWASCRAYLERFQELGAFDLRYYGVVGSLGIDIVALVAFALSVRWGESASKILRGPRLFTGRRALKAYAKAARAECRACRVRLRQPHGHMDLAAFAGLFLARDGDVPFSAEVLRAAAWIEAASLVMVPV